MSTFKYAINVVLALCFVLPVLSQNSDVFPVPDSYKVEGIPPIRKSEVDHLFFDASQVRSNLIWDVDRKNRSILITDEKNYIYRLDSPMEKPQTVIDERSPNMVRVSPKGRVFAFTDDKEDADNFELHLRDEVGKIRKLSSFSGKDQSVESFVWDEAGKRIFYAKIDYEKKSTRLCDHDLSRSACYDVDLKGIWNVVDSDRNKVLLKHWKSSSNQSLYIYDLNSKRLITVEDKGNSTKGFFGLGRVFWLSEGSAECGPEICLSSMDLKAGIKTRINLPEGIANLQDVKISPDKRSFLIQEMRDGIDNMRIGRLWKNAIIETVQPFIRGPSVVWNTRWLSNKEIAYTTENISKPASIEVFDISSKRTTAWTQDVIASTRTPAQERAIAPHPSLKPQSFLRQLVYAVLPLGVGTVLDPFAGSGSTLAACEALGISGIGIERDSKFFQLSLKSVPALAAIKTDFPGMLKNPDDLIQHHLL
ncbi:hypothetical protein J4558_25845 [Leptolyngbya sp. 15MV]|nr:hypothetical protein J4558_25845 [Leptolyngbya sp. 15MV]